MKCAVGTTKLWSATLTETDRRLNAYQESNTANGAALRGRAVLYIDNIYINDPV